MPTRHISISGPPVDFKTVLSHVKKGNKVVIEETGNPVAVIKPYNSSQSDAGSETKSHDRVSKRHNLTSEVWYG